VGDVGVIIGFFYGPREEVSRSVFQKPGNVVVEHRKPRKKRLRERRKGVRHGSGEE